MLGLDAIILLIISLLLVVLLLIKSRKLKIVKQNLVKNQNILDSINIPLFYKDAHGKFTGFNKAFEKDFMNFKKQAIEELKEYKTTTTQEIELTWDNGIKKHTLMYLTNYLDGSVGALVDINDTSKTKYKVLKKYEALDLALKGSLEGHWEWDIHSDKIILSKRAKEILGFSEDEKAPECITDWMNLVESYDISTTNEALAAHIDGRAPHIDVDHRLKTSLKETWVNFRGKGIYSGKVMTKIYGTIRDISSQKEKLTKLQKQKNLYTTFLDNLPALAFIKDKEGKYIYLNTYYQKLIGFMTWKNKTAHDLFDNNIARHIKESDREAFYENINKHEEIITNEMGIKKLFETYKFPIDSEKEKVLCGFGLDISKEHTYKKKIELFAKVIANINEGIIITDEKTNIISVNKAFCDITGFSEKEVIGKNPNIRKSGQHTQEFYEKLWKELLTKGVWSGEIFNKNKNGQIMPELLNISAIRDKKDKITNFVGIFQSIQEQKLIELKLKKMAHFDMLTGLANRTLFEDRLTHSMIRAKRGANLVALIFIDLDDFKIINDTKGHDCGDIVLKEVARRLSGVIRDSDTVARLGGDEFIVILEKITYIEDVTLIAEKIISQIDQPINLGNKEHCTIGTSLGISIYPDQTQDSKELLKFADEAMYKAKNAGKNCYRVYGN